MFLGEAREHNKYKFFLLRLLFLKLNKAVFLSKDYIFFVLYFTLGLWPIWQSSAFPCDCYCTRM